MPTTQLNEVMLMENKQLKAEKVSVFSSHENSDVINITAGIRGDTCPREGHTSSST